MSSMPHVFFLILRYSGVIDSIRLSSYLCIQWYLLLLIQYNYYWILICDILFIQSIFKAFSFFFQSHIFVRHIFWEVLEGFRTPHDTVCFFNWFFFLLIQRLSSSKSCIQRFIFVWWCGSSWWVLGILFSLM